MSEPLTEDTAFVAWLETAPTKVGTVPWMVGWMVQKDFVASHLNSSCQVLEVEKRSRDLFVYCFACCSKIRMIFMKKSVWNKKVANHYQWLFLVPIKGGR